MNHTDIKQRPNKATDEPLEFPSDIPEMQNQKHSLLFADLVVALKNLFADVPDANVGGDQAFYWNPKSIHDVIAPDAHIIRNADKTPRDSFKLWAEKQANPNFSIRFVAEIWSKSNPMWERYEKYDRYRLLGATEYLQIDLNENTLLLHRLDAEGNYQVVKNTDAGRVYSEEIDAELALENDLIRFYRNGKKILSAQEERAEKEAALAELARLKELLAERGRTP